MNHPIKRRTRVALVTALTLLLLPIFSHAGPLAKLRQKKEERRQEKISEIQTESYQPGDGWEPYFRDFDGLVKPFILPPEVNKDKDWIGLDFTEYTGPKVSISVMEVENKSASIQSDKDLARHFVGALIGKEINEVPLGAIEELIGTALFNSNRFDLIERKRLGNLLAEQDFNQSDRGSGANTVTTGQVLGAGYVIFGTVNEWTPEKKKAGAGGFGGFIAIGGGKKVAEVAMTFRVVDTTTSKVLFSTTQRAEAKSWSLGGGFGGGILAAAGMEKSSPISYAVQACVNKGIYQLANWLGTQEWRGSVMALLGTQEWRGSVMALEKGKIFINAGREAGLTPQTRLTALSKGTELIDPETGQSLGSSLEAIGSLLITSVEDKYSVATILQGCDGLKIGDRVELVPEG